MIKNLIVGSGFSASMVKIMINDNVKVVSLKNTNSLRSESFIRRTNLECNKFFSENTLSVGSTEFILNKAKFHDRLILGGNSNIWGGHIDLKRISENLVNFLIKKKIFFKKLSFRITGTTSHNKDLAQLQTSSGKILKAQDILGKIENIFILDFFIKNKKIFVNLLYLNSLKKKQIEVKKLFLCIGTIQLIDLLYRSKFIKEKDKIEFSEFDHKFIYRFKKSRYKKNTTTIRYLFSRALGHFLGIQSYSKYLRLLNFIPICIDQRFYYNKSKYILTLKKKTFIGKKNKKDFKNFGESIHYCNMKINSVPINKIFSKINKNLLGFGMPFVNQSVPGPISNDIILDVKKKLSFFNLIRKIK